MVQVGQKFSPSRTEDTHYSQTRGLLTSLGLQKYENNFKKGLLTDNTLPLLTDRWIYCYIKLFQISGSAFCLVNYVVHLSHDTLFPPVHLKMSIFHPDLGFWSSIRYTGSKLFLLPEIKNLNIVSYTRPKVCLTFSGTQCWRREAEVLARCILEQFILSQYVKSYSMSLVLGILIRPFVFTFHL